MWTAALALLIVWTDQYCLWIFGIQEGYPLMHPLLPLMRQPSLLLLLPIVGKRVLTLFFLLTSSSVVALIWYKNSKAIVVCMCAIIPWLLCYYIGLPEKKLPDVCSQIKSLPCMAHSTVNNPIVTITIIGNQLKKIIHNYPQTEVIIMPESAFNVTNFADLPEMLQLWDDKDVWANQYTLFLVPAAGKMAITIIRCTGCIAGCCKHVLIKNMQC